MIDIASAYNRIKNYIIKTPILNSKFYDKELEHQIYFKLESLQKTKAFKFRGILNTLLYLKEKQDLPKKIVT